MSEEVNTTQQDAIKGLLSSLVPPDEIVFCNIFGDEFVRPSNISAQKASFAIVSSRGFLCASDERVLKALCACFTLAHKKPLEETIAKAKEQDVDFEVEFAAADLFSIEELVSSIIPLFIRIAKRAGQAIRALSEAA